MATKNRSNSKPTKKDKKGLKKHSFFGMHRDLGSKAANVDKAMDKLRDGRFGKKLEILRDATGLLKSKDDSVRFVRKIREEWD